MNFSSGSQSGFTALIFNFVDLPDFLCGKMCSISLRSVVRSVFMLIYANPFFILNPENLILESVTLFLIISPVFLDLIEG